MEKNLTWGIFGILLSLALAIVQPNDTKRNEALKSHSTEYLPVPPEASIEHSKSSYLIRGKRFVLGSKIDDKNLEEHLELFLGILKSFLQGPGFDSYWFKKETIALKRKFLELERRFQNVYRPKKEVEEKFHWVKHMFSTMINSSDVLSFYNLKGSTDQSLIYKMVQFNVKLLAMYNSRGVPENQNTRYTDSVHYHRRILRQWIQIFKKVPRVPLNRKLIFESQILRAEKTLKDLESHGLH